MHATISQAHIDPEAMLGCCGVQEPWIWGGLGSRSQSLVPVLVRDIVHPFWTIETFNSELTVGLHVLVELVCHHQSYAGGG